MTPTPITFSPLASSMALAAFDATARPGGVEHVEGTLLSHALIGALHSAEVMAAKVGASAIEAGPDGMARIRIGDALRNVDCMPEPARTIYLATHRAVHEATEAARPLAPGETSRAAYTTPPRLATSAHLAPVVIAVVVGVVALAAWGMAREGARIVEVGGDHLRQVTIANRAAELQAAGTPPDADAWRVLHELAAKDVPGRGLLDAGPGALLLIGAVGAGWWWWSTRKAAT